VHEMSLARSLAKQVQELLADRGAGTVTGIRLRCGTLSGVEPALLASAFDVLRREVGLDGARLHIEEVPLEARCESCQTVFRPEGFRFRCPECGSGDTTVVQGEALILESIEWDPIPKGEPV
jgi:hydrogenase nickel incorporation protein HypA/HybF